MIREKFWWKKYLEEDKNIIRPVDGYEYFLTFNYLGVTDIFPKFETEDFYICAQNNLPQIEIFNYQFKYIEQYPFWYRKKFELIKNINFIEINNLGETDYKKYLEKENICQGINDNFDPNDKSIKLSFRIEICQINENQTMLSLKAFHATSDGRTIFNIFDYVRKIVEFITENSNNKELIKTKIFLEKKEAKICPFGQYENYINLYKKLYEKPPEKWFEVPLKRILPDLEIDEKTDKGKIHYISQYHIFDYKKVNEFCKKYRVSVQAMLATMLSRATRKYFNLSENFPIYNYTPCDSRPSKLATEYLKNREFFCGAGALFPKSIGQGDLIKDIQYNYNSLKECIPKLENIIQIMRSSMAINDETLEMNPETKMPTFSSHSCTCSSNIGKVKGNLPCFNICMDLKKENAKKDYILCFYSVHTDKYLVILDLKPNFLNKKFYDTIIDEMNLIFNYEKMISTI